MVCSAGCMWQTALFKRMFKARQIPGAMHCSAASSTGGSSRQRPCHSGQRLQLVPGWPSCAGTPPGGHGQPQSQPVSHGHRTCLQIHHKRLSQLSRAVSARAVTPQHALPVIWPRAPDQYVQPGPSLRPWQPATTAAVVGSWLACLGWSHGPASATQCSP